MWGKAVWRPEKLAIFKDQCGRDLVSSEDIHDGRHRQGPRHVTPRGSYKGKPSKASAWSREWHDPLYIL